MPETEEKKKSSIALAVPPEEEIIRDPLPRGQALGRLKTAVLNCLSPGILQKEFSKRKESETGLLLLSKFEEFVLEIGLVPDFLSVDAMRELIPREGKLTGQSFFNLIAEFLTRSSLKEAGWGNSNVVFLDQFLTARRYAIEMAAILNLCGGNRPSL